MAGLAQALGEDPDAGCVDAVVIADQNAHEYCGCPVRFPDMITDGGIGTSRVVIRTLGLGHENRAQATASRRRGRAAGRCGVVPLRDRPGACIARGAVTAAETQAAPAAAHGASRR